MSKNEILFEEEKLMKNLDNYINGGNQNEEKRNNYNRRERQECWRKSCKDDCKAV